MAEQTLDWIDLSAHGAQMAALRFPDGKIRIVLSGLRDGGADWNWAVEKQGFTPSRNRIALFREGGKVEFKPFLDHFKNARQVKMPRSKILRVVSVPAPQVAGASPTAPTPNAADLEARTAIPIGINHLGQQVFEGGAGRFIRNAQGGETITESEMNTPAVFLRAPTAADLAQCADGLVESMVRGTVLRADDLKRFASIILDGKTSLMDVADVRLRRVQEAVEAAMQRRLERDSVAPDRAAFDLAVAMIERQPPLIYRTSSSIELQQYSTPLPMAIAAQHALGDTGGKRGLEPTIGNGSLVSALSRDAAITGYEIDPSRVANLGGMRMAIDVHQGDFTGATLDVDFDFVISNPPFGGLKPERSIDGLRITRLDHLILMKSLLARKEDGRAVYIVGADHQTVMDKHAGEISGGSKNLFNYLADHYELEGVAEIDGRLYEKQGAGYPVRMVVVGRRRSEIEAAEARQSKAHRLGDRLPVLRSWEEVWAFADKLAPAREAEAVVDAVAIEDEVPTEAERFENLYQSPYNPASKIGEPDSMIPRNLVGPTSAALERVEEQFGPVDDFVADRLEMTLEQLEKAFSPEQVDALALAIARVEQGLGFILGDQTGLGKGRVVAGMARYAALQGRGVTFITEKANLFSDFYRDLADIGSADLFRPLILNDKVDIRDQQNRRLIAPTPKETVKKLIDDQATPADYGFNMVMATYSQFNLPAEKSGKGLWLPRAVAGDVLILDESHNAAGESNTAENIADAVEQAWGVVYSSATFAKSATSMRAYAKAFPKGVCSSDLPDVLAAGGEPLQEILSSMLAEDGAFIRREHDLSKLAFETYIDHENRERNEKLADQLSEILLQMSYMSGDIGRMVEQMQKDIRKRLKELGDEQRKGNRMGVSSSNFGSRLYNILRQFQLSLKVDAAAELGIQALRDGKKPVWVVEQTMESLLKETLFDFEDEDEEAGEKAKVNGPMTIEPLTFRDVLTRALDRIQVIVKRDDYGSVTRTTAIAEAKNEEQAKAWAASTRHIRELIAKFPDLPVSPLDILSHKIEQAGFSVGEISGRGLTVSMTDDGKMTVFPRTDDRLKTIHGFNSGEIDGVELTRAGSTGLSLHASEKFVDQRQRVLLELQIANNVAERLQFFGRVNRKGQVCAPGILSISSGLPGEMRVLAMQNAKLRKLSANTQSNRNNAAEMKDIPDILNKLGNEICYRFLENNPDVAMTLGIELDEERLSADEAWFANKLTGYISLLPVARQKEIFEQLLNEYQTTLLELEALGENPFKAQEFEWGAVVAKRELFDGTEGGNSRSPFHEPVYLTRLEWEEEITPMRWPEVSAAIGFGIQELRGDGRVDPPTGEHDGSANLDRLIEVINRRINGYVDARGGEVRGLKHEALGKFPDVDAAMTSDSPNPVKNLETRRAFLVNALQVLKPGNRVRIPGEGGDPVMGIVTDLWLPAAGKEHLPGQYSVRVMVPGERRPRELTINMLLQANLCERSFYWPDMTRDDEAMFNNAPGGRLTFSRLVLDGNLFRAAQIASERGLGRPVVYTDADGQRHRAILVKSTFQMSDVKSLPVRVDDERILAELLRLHPKRTFSTSSSGRQENTVSIGFTYGSLADAELTVPGTKTQGGRYFGNKGLIGITGEFAGSRSAMRARFPASRLGDALAEIYRMGERFYIPADLKADMQAIAERLNKRDAVQAPARDMRLAASL